MTRFGGGRTVELSRGSGFDRRTSRPRPRAAVEQPLLSPAWLALGATALGGAGLWGGRLFAQSDCIASAQDMSVWRNAAGYTPLQFVGLALQTFCLPPAAVLTLHFASHAFKHPLWTRRRKVVAFGWMAALLAAGGLWSERSSGALLTGCGVFCFSRDVEVRRSRTVIVCRALFPS